MPDTRSDPYQVESALVIACEAFYYGHIEYADIFGKLRRTDFCFSYKVEGMPLCDPHNEIDPDD